MEQLATKPYTIAEFPGPIPAIPFKTDEPPVRVIRRDGSVSPFNPTKIAVAMTKAFLAVEGASADASRRVHETVAGLSEQVVSSLIGRGDRGRALHIEDIQDQVELALMRGGHHKSARAYVLYREERARERRAKAAPEAPAGPQIRVRLSSGVDAQLDWSAVATSVERACRGLEHTSHERVLKELERSLYDGMTEEELATAKVLAARSLVENDPDYSFVSARLLLERLRRRALPFLGLAPEGSYAEAFPAYLRRGVELDFLDPSLPAST